MAQHQLIDIRVILTASVNSVPRPIEIPYNRRWRNNQHGERLSYPAAIDTATSIRPLSPCWVQSTGILGGWSIGESVKLRQARKARRSHQWPIIPSCKSQV